MHVSITSVCIETKIKSIKPIYHYIDLFIGSTNIFISCFILCPHGDVQGKYYNLIDMSVHGEHTDPNPVFIARFSHEYYYDRLNKHLLFIFRIVAIKIEFISVPTD